MTVIPMLFTEAMVRALLAGTKTQTRRIFDYEPPSWCYADRNPGFSYMTPPRHVEFRGIYVDEAGIDHGPGVKFAPLRYWNGDLLYVREAHWRFGCWYRNEKSHWAFQALDDAAPIRYIENAPTTIGSKERRTEPGFWLRPGIFMPRAASRLTLDVRSVKVERLQAISEEDARAEGLTCLSKDDGRTFKFGIADRDGWPGADNIGWHWHEWDVDPRRAYATLWGKINGADAWAKNPWVVVPNFSVIKENIDVVLSHREAA